MHRYGGCEGGREGREEGSFANSPIFQDKNRADEYEREITGLQKSLKVRYSYYILSSISCCRKMKRNCTIYYTYIAHGIHRGYHRVRRILYFYSLFFFIFFTTFFFSAQPPDGWLDGGGGWLRSAYAIVYVWTN